MNTRNRFKQALGLGAVVVSIIALAAIFTASPVLAHRSDPAVNVLPPVGVAFGQTLVSFLNVGSNPVEIQPCIFDGDGEHLKTGATITLAPGQTRSFDLSRSEIVGRTGNSVEVRAGVHANRPDLKNLVASGELIEDATGKSSLYVPGDSSRREPGADGDVTISPVGIVAGQSLRVTYFNNGRSPLEIVPCIFDGDGAHLRSGSAITLQPGQMRSLEITWNEAAAGRTGLSFQVRGAVHVLRNDAKHLVIAGEVVEDATGKSSLYVAPGTMKGFDPQPDPPQ
jgi:hypothetical protein